MTSSCCALATLHNNNYKLFTNLYFSVAVLYRDSKFTNVIQKVQSNLTGHFMLHCQVRHNFFFLKFLLQPLKKHLDKFEFSLTDWSISSTVLIGFSTRRNINIKMNFAASLWKHTHNWVPEEHLWRNIHFQQLKHIFKLAQYVLLHVLTKKFTISYDFFQCSVMET